MKRSRSFVNSNKGTTITNTSTSYAHNRFKTFRARTSDLSVIDSNGHVVNEIQSGTFEDHNNVGAFNGVFSIILAILVLVNIFLTLTDSGQFIGFERFLEICSNAWVIPTDWLTNFSNLGIEASSWGAFSFFANFLNRIKDFVSVCAFLGVGCVQIITYIIYFLGAFLFV